MIKFNKNNLHSKFTVLPLFLIIFLIFAFFINNDFNTVKDSNTTGVQKQQNNPFDNKKNEESENIVKAGQLVLAALKEKDYIKLENLISSEGLTVSLSPNGVFESEIVSIYGSKDNFQTKSPAKKNFSKKEILNIGINNKNYVFGNTHDSGEPIIDTIQSFFDKWIYNHDYIQAPEVFINEVREDGSSIKTLKEDVGSMNFILYHFPSSNIELATPDWTSMYLVFKKENNQYKLRAIVKDNFTI